MAYDQALVKQAQATWDRMYSTAGQDQWPCDVLIRLQREMLNGSDSDYSADELEEMLPELLALTVADDARTVLSQVVKAVIAERRSG